MSENGKGSKRRPRDERFCSEKQLSDNWQNAFKQKEMKAEMDLDLGRFVIREQKT